MRTKAAWIHPTENDGPVGLQNDDGQASGGTPLLVFCKPGDINPTAELGLVFLKTLCEERDVRVEGVFACSAIPVLTGARLTRWVLSALGLHAAVGICAVRRQEGTRRERRKSSTPAAFRRQSNQDKKPSVASEHDVLTTIFSECTSLESPAQMQVMLVQRALELAVPADVAKSWWFDNVVSTNVKAQGNTCIPHAMFNLEENKEDIFGGQHLLKLKLQACAPRSMVVVVNSVMTDLALFLSTEKARQLFREKVLRVVVQGGVQVDDKGEILRDEDGSSLLDPSAANNKADLGAAKRLYKICFELSVPVWTFGRHGAAASAVTSQLFVQIKDTGNYLARFIYNSQVEALESLWKRVCSTGSGRGGLPLACDRKW